MEKIHSVTQFLRENFMQEQNSGGAFQIFQNIKKNPTSKISGKDFIPPPSHPT